MNEQKVARGLGWFSVALGTIELAATRPFAKFFGLERLPEYVRLGGAREIGVGLGLLTRRKRSPWLWARVGGDMLDLLLLVEALRPSNARRRRAQAAMGAVVAITALDVFCGYRLKRRGR